MRFSQNDTIIILKDYPQEAILQGDIGVIVDIYTIPKEAYEVEFVREDGTTKALIVLEDHELMKYEI